MFTDRRRTVAARTPRAEEALQGAGTSRTPEERRPDSETVPHRFAEEPPWAGPFPVQLHAAHIPRSLGIETAQSATLGRHFGLWTRMSFEAQTHFLTLQGPLPTSSSLHCMETLPLAPWLAHGSPGQAFPSLAIATIRQAALRGLPFVRVL